MGFQVSNGDDNHHHRRLLSEIATNDGHGENSSYFDGWKAYDSNPFDPIRNPEGVIQMGLAENQLCHDLMEDWIKKNPEASICTADGVSAFKAVANFQDYHGLPAFRKAVAKFMTKVRGGRPEFDPDRIVMTGGATGAQELLAFCLADPGDAFLIPTPYYPGFDRDFRWRTGAQLIPVHCHSSNGFELTRPALESAFDRARESSARVKGVLVTNPSNPLGTTMGYDSLRALLSFVTERRIHLVVDEIFAGTVFGGNFVSVSEVLEDEPGNSFDRDLVHVVYSLSKSLGLPGFRVGVVYSYNDGVVACGRKMSSFGLVSSQTQHLLASMLSDDAFTTKFLEASAGRLLDRHDAFVSGLARVGVRCLESDAGLFCWMDLRPLLKSRTVDGEIELWRVIVDDVRLNVSPGSSFHCAEPGWFRACFANVDDRTMEVALRRIRTFVGRVGGAHVEAEKKTKEKRWKGALQLSLPRRFEAEMGIVTPRLMSPHSPLVHAAT